MGFTLSEEERAEAKGTMLGEISSCVDEAYIAKGEMLSISVWQINIMGNMPRRNNKGFMSGCKMELRKFIFLAFLHRCLLFKRVYIKRRYQELWLLEIEN